MNDLMQLNKERWSLLSLASRSTTELTFQFGFDQELEPKESSLLLVLDGLMQCLIMSGSVLLLELY